ncbi:MAG TPA: SLC13 family permease [Candidatus Limnocylindrales bacterium]|nr:SLC13 family permease [Candidatus Limnocylindrales bacterium]
MSEAAITFAVIAALVVLFVWGRLPVEVVAIGAALVLWASGVLTLEQSLAGFGDPVIIFIATLFVVSEGLDSTGVTAWAGQQLIDRSGASRTRLLVLMMLVVAALTAVVTVNAAVAALLPVIVVTATRLGVKPSKLLMPLCFGAHAGSQLALTGSNVNLLISDAAIQYSGAPFGFFEFALVGIPLVVGTIAIVALFSDRLLPDRTPRTISPDLSQHARTLVRQYGLAAAAGEDVAPVGFSRDVGLAEVVIPPRSPFIGERVFQGMVTESGDLVVVGIQRKGQDLGEREVELVAGDALLLHGPWAALDAKAEDPGVLVVDQPDLVRRQAVPLGLRAWESILVLIGMVALLVSGVVPPAVAGLLAAGALIVLRVVGMEQAYRSITWTTVVLVAAMLPLSTAMFESGAADIVGGALIDVVGGFGPYGLLIGLFVVTAIFGQLISNTATALIVIPIGVAAASELGVDVRPVLMSINVAAAAALLTPVATPVNLIAMGAAGYKFGDYWRLGLLCMVVFLAVAVLVVPLAWPF